MFSQKQYWIYRDGKPVKRMGDTVKASIFAQDLHLKHPESHIEVKLNELISGVVLEYPPFKHHKGNPDYGRTFA